MNEALLLKTAVEGGFWSYACGVAYEIITNYQVPPVATMALADCVITFVEPHRFRA